MLRKVASPKGLMMFYLEQSLRKNSESGFGSSSGTREETLVLVPCSVQDWGSGSVSSEGGFISALYVSELWGSGRVEGCLAVTGRQGGVTLRLLQLLSTLILLSPSTGSEGKSAP